LSAVSSNSDYELELAIKVTSDLAKEEERKMRK